MFTRIKKIIIAAVLLLPLALPFGQTAQAYGVANHESVIDIGKNHFVVLKNDGSVWSWGDHTYGQLGVRLNPNSSSNPSAIRKNDGDRLSNIQSIAAGGDHTVALDKNNNVWTWGRNSNGQLGYETAPMAHSAEPTIVKLDDGSNLQAIAIAAGEFHTLAVDTAGQVWAWGSGKFGQIGSTSDTIFPQKVSIVSDAVAVAAGANHSLALTRDGRVYTWGRNTNGQLGNGKSAHINASPSEVERLSGIMAIAAGDNHTLALARDRTTVWAWGSNAYGQLGDGGMQERLYPVTVENIHSVKKIAAGSDHTIAIKDDGSVWTWGRNTSGTQTVRTTPIHVKGINNTFAIGGGGANAESYTLALDHEGKVWQWDKNSSDPTTALPIFKQVSGIDDVMKKIDYPFIQGEQVYFKYEGAPSDMDVQVFGSFNDWVGIPLVKNGNEWTLQIPLPAGKYEYGFKVNNKWIADPLNTDRGISEAGDLISYINVAQYPIETPIIDDRDVTFYYSSYDFDKTLEFDAETSYVAVKGSFNGWVEIPMEKRQNNTWTKKMTLPQGDYSYDFVVRDRATGALTEQRLDPLNKKVEENPTTGSKRNTFSVSEQIITKVPVEDITIDRGPMFDMIVGEQMPLQATISPSNATDKRVSWRSSDPSIISVDNGQLTAYAEGTAVIIATSVADGSIMDTVTVTVFKQDGAVLYPRPGYISFDAKTNVAPNHVWTVKFSKELDETSVNPQNVYIIDETGQRVPTGYKLNDLDDTKLEVYLLSGYTYAKGATYYMFIEDTLRTKYGNLKLKEKRQMKFQIEL